MIDELIKHGKQERSLTDQAQEEAKSIRDAADKLASQHYESIIKDYQEKARAYRRSKLDDADEKLEEVRDDAQQRRKQLSKTRDKLDDHATAIVNQLQTVIDDNT